MVEEKRTVEHYRDHELVCTATLEPAGWQYTISIVETHLDETEVYHEASTETYSSDLLALQAAVGHARRVVDERSADADE